VVGWLLHEFGDLVADGIGPDLVAFGAEVEEVGHDFAWEGAIGCEEGFADVEEVDFLVIG